MTNPESQYDADENALTDDDAVSSNGAISTGDTYADDRDDLSGDDAPIVESDLDTAQPYRTGFEDLEDAPKADGSGA
jgi:hypothetical protein